MKKFTYVALDATGKEVDGEIEAENFNAAIDALRGRGLFPTKCEETLPGVALKALPVIAASSPHLSAILTHRATVADRAHGWATLGTLLASGVSILQALTAVAKSSVWNEHVFLAAHKATQAGQSLVPAIEKMLPPYEAALIAIGEETGQLPEMLLRIAKDKAASVPSADYQFILVNSLAPLLDAGLPLGSALERLVIHAESSNSGFAVLVGAILKDIRQGQAFYEALAARPERFDAMCVDCAKAGVLSGTLEKTLQAHAEHMLRGYEAAGMLLP